MKKNIFLLGLLIITEAHTDNKLKELQTIVITAEKSEQLLQDSHPSVSVLDQYDLKDGNIKGTEDLIQSTPNVYSFTPNFGSFLNIRGVGGRRPEETGVGFIVDGVHQQNFSSDMYFDTHRVEIVKGAQGTIYGRNTEAGVINIISNQVKYADETKLNFGYAEHQSTQFSLIHNTAINKKWATRIGHLQKRTRGGIRNEVSHINDGNASELSKTFFKLRHQGFGDLTLKLDIDRNIGGFDKATPLSSQHNDKTFNDTLGEINNNAHGISLKYEFQKYEYNWTLLTAYRNSTDIMELDLDLNSYLNTPGNTFLGRFSDNFRDLSQEIRAVKETQIYDLMLGAYFLSRRTEFSRSFYFTNAPSATPLNISDVSGYNYAIFSSYHFKGPNYNIKLGARLSA